jgi:HEPN/Toprim N-terminal domain 1
MLLDRSGRVKAAMGSMIHLSVGRLEIDWGKNRGSADHSPLFQTTDLSQVPYYYVDEENPHKEGGNEYEFNLVTENKDGLSKPLSQVIERINLLGYTMKYARREFEFLSHLSDFDTEKFSFEELAKALATVDVQSVSADYGQGEDFGKFFRRYMFDRLGLEYIVNDHDYVRFPTIEGAENLSAYTVLQLLGRNPSASTLPVNWGFADVEYGGWARRDQFVKPLDQSNRFLIVTEGSSDAGIIRHAFRLLKPHLSDFFDFVDMNEGYPFTGTGSLFNFTKGLISISVQNNVIIVYDNDAEGVSNFNRSAKLNIPANMRVLKLPDLPKFQAFETIGPSGHHRADINGRGAAIECYLDVGPSPVVRWNNYNKELGVYHGELVSKRDVMNRFYSMSELGSGYDLSKISAVLNMIITDCISMREAAQLADLEADFPLDDEGT